MSSGGLTGKVMLLVLFSKALTQVYVEFPNRLMLHHHRCGRLCMMMVFTCSTFWKCNTFTKRSHQWCAIFQLLGRTLKGYELDFMYVWGPISLWWYHQYKKFTLLVLWQSTWGRAE